MKRITHEQLVAHLLGLRGATFCTITARTDARAKKTNNPFALPIMKTATINGCLNFHYDAGVLRRLEKEGKDPKDFEKGESWHEPVFDNGHLTPLCIHKKNRDKLYLRLMVVQLVGLPIYHDAFGKEVAYDDIKEFLPARSSYENQGLNNPLIFTVYDLANLLSITFNNQTFELADLKIASEVA